MKLSFANLFIFLLAFSTIIFTFNNTNATQLSSADNIESFQTKSEKKRKKVKSGFIRGPKGGCYYKNRNGKKTYVSRSLCNR